MISSQLDDVGGKGVVCSQDISRALLRTYDEPSLPIRASIKRFADSARNRGLVRSRPLQALCGRLWHSSSDTRFGIVCLPTKR